MEWIMLELILHIFDLEYSYHGSPGHSRVRTKPTVYYFDWLS
jgi:hypothetical protein